jgi:hypothetical protein
MKDQPLKNNNNMMIETMRMMTIPAATTISPLLESKGPMPATVCCMLYVTHSIFFQDPF